MYGIQLQLTKAPWTWKSEKDVCNDMLAPTQDYKLQLKTVEQTKRLPAAVFARSAAMYARLYGHVFNFKTDHHCE